MGEWCPTNAWDFLNERAAFESERSACAFWVGIRQRLDWQDDIEFLVLKFEHELDPGQLIRDTKVNSRGGTHEVHRFRGLTNPGAHILKVKAGLLLLKKYSHTLHSAWR
jgi:hypothetical protein